MARTWIPTACSSPHLEQLLLAGHHVEARLGGDLVGAAHVLVKHLRAFKGGACIEWGGWDRGWTRSWGRGSVEVLWVGPHRCWSNICSCVTL